MSQKLIGIAQMQISADTQDVLTAPNLGSCVGVAVYDPESKRGGLIHCLLPTSRSDPEKAANNPFMYVDSGVPLLLEEILRSAPDKKRVIIVAVGGASINDPNNTFEIGKKNYTILKKILWKNNLLLKAEDFGDSCSRTLSLHLAEGEIFLKTRGETRKLY